MTPEAPPFLPTGRRAQRTGAWYAPAPWAFGTATAIWLVAMLRQWPCIADPGRAYDAMCYSDVVALWGHRGIDQALLPYVQVDLEYPVLTGAFMWLSRQLSGLLPGDRPDLAFLGVTATALFCCFLGLVGVHLRFARPGDAVMVAASPLVAASALINWDMLVVFLASAALLAWARRRPGLAGVLVALGTSAKLYPVLLLVAFVLLAARAGEWRALGRTVLGAAVTWVAVNLPVYLAAPEGWLHFWTFNAERTADLGSVWYVLSLAGWQPANLALLQASLMLGGLTGLAALSWWAPRRPRVAQVAFLAVVLFLVVNTVYSPQYMLWLLPLVVLARPVWTDWLVFTVGELVYFLAVWPFLDGNLYDGSGRAPLYWLAVGVRVGVQVWIAGRVVRDILRPDADPVRARGADDPDGGVLDGVPDAAWMPRHRSSR